MERRLRYRSLRSLPRGLLRRHHDGTAASGRSSVWGSVILNNGIDEGKRGTRSMYVPEKIPERAGIRQGYPPCMFAPAQM